MERNDNDNRDGHDADHPIEIDDSSDDEDDNEMVDGDDSSDMNESGVFDQRRVQQELELDQMLLDDIQQAGEAEEQEEARSTEVARALNVDEDQEEFDSSCMQQEKELDQMLLDDIQKAEDLDFSLNQPSQATVNHDIDDENGSKSYSWKSQSRESRSCRRDQEAVRAPVNHIETAPAPNSTFRTEFIKIDMRLPVLEETDIEGDEPRVLFTRKDLQLCLIDRIEKELPSTKNHQIRTYSTALSLESKTTAKSSGWSVVLVDNADTPHTATLEVTGIDEFHTSVKNRLNRFLKSARNFHMWQSLFDDEDTVLIDVDIDMESLISGRKLGIEMDPIAFPRPRRFGAWIDNVKDDGILWTVLGSNLCEHINKFGGCLLAVEGDRVSQSSDVITSVRKTQRAFRQARRENLVDQKAHITFTLVISKYADFEPLLENRSEINVRRLDGTEIDRKYYRENRLNVDFNRVFEDNPRPLLPLMWVEYDENVVPRPHNMHTKAPITEHECFEAYSTLMEGEDSVEMDIVIPADDLGGTPYYFDRGAFISNISDSSPFTNVLGKKATKFGLVLHLIDGQEFNNPDMLVIRLEKRMPFGVTVVLFDGVDLRDADLDCLYRRSLTRKHPNYLLTGMMNPRRRKRPLEGYPLRMNQNRMAHEQQPLDLNHEPPNGTDTRRKQNGSARANNSFESELSTNNDDDSDDDFNVFLPANDDAIDDQNRDRDGGGDGGGSSQQKHQSHLASASNETTHNDNEDTDNDFHEFFDAKEHINDDSGDDNDDDNRQNNRSNSGSAPDETRNVEYDANDSRATILAGLSSPSSLTTDSKRSTGDLGNNDSFSSPGGTKSKPDEYRRFEGRYYKLAQNNYKDCGIHIKTCISSMWKQHKAIFEDQSCHDHCPCIFSTKKLVENVFNDHETANKHLDAGIFEHFAPIFVPKLRQEYPSENASQLLNRLSYIWSLHKQDRVYGIRCGPRCECESEWDQQFGMGNEDTAKAFRMARKRPSYDLLRKDRSDGKTTIPRKAPAGNKTPKMNLLASPSSRPLSLPSSARKYSFNSSKFERHFNAQRPLGAFFGTQTFGDVSTCKVLAINMNGQIGMARDVMPHTTVEAVMKAEKRIPISSHNDLKHHYNEAKKNHWHFNLVLFNPKYANRPSGGRSDYWNEQGDWVGPADWNGWAGGANQYSLSTINQNLRGERFKETNDYNDSRDDLRQTAHSYVPERNEDTELNVNNEAQFLVDPKHDESKKGSLMKATREGTFDEFIRCLQSNVCRDFLVAREGLKQAYDLCSSRLRAESDQSARKEVEMKKEILKIYINGARGIEMATTFAEWTTISIRIRRIEIFLKTQVANELEKSDSRLEGIIRNRVVSAAPVNIDAFPLHIRQNNITGADQDDNKHDDEKTPSIPTLDELIADCDLIEAEDEGVWPDHILASITQLIPCRVTENDIQGPNRHLKTGFVGLCCRWCGGKPFFGRYFPDDMSKMGSRDTHNAIFRHFEEDCMYCPPLIWRAITNLNKDMVPKSSIGDRLKLTELIWKRVQSSQPDERADFKLHPENKGIKYTQAERVAACSSGKNLEKRSGLTVRTNGRNATTIVLDTEKEFIVKNNQKLTSEEREVIVEITPSIGSFVFRLNDLEKQSANDGSWTPLSRTLEETESWTKAVIEMDVKRAFLERNDIARKKVDAGKRVKEAVAMVTNSRPLLNNNFIINDIQSIDGSTLLHAALCVDASEDLLKTLLQLGADPNQANSLNKSPNELVRNYESRSIKKTKELENNNAPKDRIENQRERTKHFRAVLDLFQRISRPHSPTR